MTNSKIMKAIIAGIVATAVMTLVGVTAPYMELPKMNPAEMLSSMLRIAPALAWLMHFMIGIIFSLAYVYWFDPTVRINSRFLKGLVFGFAVFVFAQIVMFLMGIVITMPPPENPMLMMLGSLMGHFVYGVFVAWVVSWLSVRTDHPATAT
jgi:hypothetical protein